MNNIKNCLNCYFHVIGYSETGNRCEKCTELVDKFGLDGHEKYWTPYTDKELDDKIKKSQEEIHEIKMQLFTLEKSRATRK